jgi:hypothetical protein
MSSRLVGYYLSNTRGKIDTDNRILTKAKAIDTAKTLLSINREKKIGVIRANDMILLMTISITPNKGFNFYKK